MRLHGNARTCLHSRRLSLAICWPFVKPSDGLEPSTPSLGAPNRDHIVDSASGGCWGSDASACDLPRPGRLHAGIRGVGFRECCALV